MASKRFITRIELTIPTREALNDLVEDSGMTQVSVLSRLVNWFAAQPAPVRALVLGAIPEEMESTIAELILRQIAHKPKGKQ